MTSELEQMLLLETQARDESKSSPPSSLFLCSNLLLLPPMDQT